MLRAVITRGLSTTARGRSSTLSTTLGRTGCLATRAFATFEESGLDKPSKSDDETFVRTPFIGDGYFQDEMGELFEFTVKIGDKVAVDDTVAVARRRRRGEASVEASRASSRASGTHGGAACDLTLRGGVTSPRARERPQCRRRSWTRTRLASTSARRSRERSSGSSWSRETRFVRSAIVLSPTRNSRRYLRRTQ